MGRSLRAFRHGAAQFCGLRGSARRLHRRHHRQRSAWPDRRAKRRRVHACDHPRQRNLDRDRVRRARARRDRLRRRPAAACRGVRDRVSRDRRWVRLHVDAGRRDAVRSATAGSARAHAKGHCARPRCRRGDRRILDASLPFAGIAGGDRGAIGGAEGLAHRRGAAHAIAGARGSGTGRRRAAPYSAAVAVGR